MPLVSSFLFRLPGRWTRRRARRTRMLVLLLLLAITFLVILPVYIVYKPPKALIGYFQTRFPDVLFHIPNTSRKIVALTIDDVPSQYTSRILEILEANDAHATFFVIGNQVAGQENSLVDVVKAGSELGNHAMHDEPSISLSSEQLNKEISQVDDMINKAYSTAGKDRTAHYFRPGSGVFSRRILGVAANAGYKTILGSIYPHDPFIKYWRVNAKHILSSLRPGAIIICHDRRSWTVPMLEHVIPEMKKRGYEIVTVSGLLKAMEG